MYITRNLEKKIMQYLNKKEIIAIIGPRQCGKTTLMRHIFQELKDAKFISFEDRETLELFALDIKAFAEIYIKNTNYLFIDEFQYAKEGGKNLKYLYDEFNTKIIISGSSAPELTVQSISHLVGRIFVFGLYPLSFDEYLAFKDESLYKVYEKGNLSMPIIERINKIYEIFAIFGGYPRVVLSDNIDEKKEVLKNIYNTYFSKEIKEIFQLQEDFKLSKLINVLALQVGGVINHNELCSATGFNFLELQKNLNILKKTYICADSRPFFTNKKKEIIKAPKLFFIDSGFRNIIIDNFQNLRKRPDSGNLNENFIASELSKKDITLKYWRTKAGAEVDFIFEKEGEIFPIEIKSSLKDANMTRSLQNFIIDYSPKKVFVLSYEFTKKRYMEKIEIEFLPLFEISKTIKMLNS